MKSLETNYDGYRFRSRVEARWAVFFDAAGIRYEYEKEGYELKGNERYLPDFYLPDFGVWLEVKGGVPTDREEALCRKLAKESDKTVWLAEGAPEPRGQIRLYNPRDPEGDFDDGLWMLADDTKNPGEFWLLGMSGTCEGAASTVGPYKSDTSDKYPCVYSNTHVGYEAAKAARFEFGETPTP